MAFAECHDTLAAFVHMTTAVWLAFAFTPCLSCYSLPVCIDDGKNAHGIASAKVSDGRMQPDLNGRCRSINAEYNLR